jgi:hypothetical protein
MAGTVSRDRYSVLHMNGADRPPIQADTNYILDMLELVAVPQTEHLYPDVFFQQDFAPPRWGLTLRIKHPPPPDIPPPDFFFWCHVKDQAFRPKVGGVVELRASINSEVASVTPQILQKTWCEIEYRLAIL